jgi:hypothetical protein
MIRTAAGLLSELVLVRLHGRAAEYVAADAAARPAIIAACRLEATVGDLPERILSRTIYAQASSRAAPLRELIQNALDASARGARIDVRSAGANGEGDVEISISDSGCGMSGVELLEDLLVPFRTKKEGDPETIGEHGIGFLGALEIAPRLEVMTSTGTEAHRLRIRPVGAKPPHTDFAWTLAPIDPPPMLLSGTTVRLTLERPVDRAALTAEVVTVAGFVDPARARICAAWPPSPSASAARSVTSSSSPGAARASRRACSSRSAACSSAIASTRSPARIARSTASSRGRSAPPGTASSRICRPRSRSTRGARRPPASRRASWKTRSRRPSNASCSRTRSTIASSSAASITASRRCSIAS